MFNLEQAIAEWRRRMLAAGIQSPVPLEELEAHLREEIAQQIEAGADAEEAFRLATKRVGQPEVLQAEFRKIKNMRNQAMNKHIRTIHFVLAALWLAACGMSLFTVGNTIRNQLPFQPSEWAGYMSSLLAMIIYAAGIAGSLLLFVKSKWGYVLLRMTALALLLICLPQVLPLPGETPGWRIWCGSWVILEAMTIWLLWNPKPLSGANR